MTFSTASKLNVGSSRPEIGKTRFVCGIDSVYQAGMFNTYHVYVWVRIYYTYVHFMYTKFVSMTPAEAMRRFSPPNMSSKIGKTKDGIHEIWNAIYEI